MRVDGGELGRVGVAQPEPERGDTSPEAVPNLGKDVDLTTGTRTRVGDVCRTLLGVKMGLCACVGGKYLVVCTTAVGAGSTWKSLLHAFALS
mmetsp:Transcript_66550/g.105290  ORF Transcript_66550/g.105290 Transcript_66550/m.105290 type:complete len:92 (-) Transcript_66550:2119-2394(-)